MKKGGCDVRLPHLKQPFLRKGDAIVATFTNSNYKFEGYIEKSDTKWTDPSSSLYQLTSTNYLLL